MSEVRRPPAMGLILVMAAISIVWFVIGVGVGIAATFLWAAFTSQ